MIWLLIFWAAGLAIFLELCARAPLVDDDGNPVEPRGRVVSRKPSHPMAYLVARIFG